MSNIESKLVETEPETIVQHMERNDRDEKRDFGALWLGLGATCYIISYAGLAGYLGPQQTTAQNVIPAVAFGAIGTHASAIGLLLLDWVPYRLRGLASRAALLGMRDDL